MPTIKLRVDAKGKATVEGVGFVGASCEAATRAYEEALAGGKPVERELKPEHAQQESQQSAEQS